MQLNSLVGITKISLYLVLVSSQFSIFRLRQKIIADFPQRAIHKIVICYLTKSMKRISPLILILNFGSLFSKSEENKLELNDTWFGGETENNGKPVIIRGRQHLKNFIDSKQYPEHIEFVWTFETDTENGIPTPEENIFMQKVEDALIESLESDLQSVLAIVYTHNGIRSLIFYTKSVSEFLKRINKALTEFKKLPIEISNDKDIDWELYTGILKSYELEPK